MARLCPPRGHGHFYHNVAVLGEPIRDVHLALANPEAPDEEPWFIISSDPTTVDSLDECALGYEIEENFLDDKLKARYWVDTHWDRGLS